MDERREDPSVRGLVVLMDDCRHLMLAEHSPAPIDMIADLGIELIQAGGYSALTTAAIARRCQVSRQAVQQWCGGRPLRVLFAERFAARWTRWAEIRTRGGTNLVGLLPTSPTVLGWTRVWSCLVTASMHDEELATILRIVHEEEVRLITRSIPAANTSLTHAVVWGIRQRACLEAAHAGQQTPPS